MLFSVADRLDRTACLEVTKNGRLGDAVLLRLAIDFPPNVVAGLVRRAHSLAGDWVLDGLAHTGPQLGMVFAHGIVAMQRLAHNLKRRQVLTGAMRREHVLARLVLKRHGLNHVLHVHCAFAHAVVERLVAVLHGRQVAVGHHWGFHAR